MTTKKLHKNSSVSCTNLLTSVMSRLLVIGRPMFHWYSLPLVYHLLE